MFLFGEALQFKAFFRCKGKRLVADDMNAGFEKSPANRIMGIVRSDDDCEVNAVRPGCL